MMADRKKYIEVLSKAVKTVKECNEDAPIKISLECIEDILELLKEQEKLINVDELREKLGFSDNCENCKQNARHCQYDSHFALMDFCERLDMAIEELMTEGR